MDYIKVIVIAAVVALVFLGGVTYFGSDSVGPKGERGDAGQSGQDGSLGAFPGPDIFADKLCVNEVCQYNRSIKWNNASTTLCNIFTPPATSSLISFSAKSTIATSTRIEYTLATSTIQSATTSIITPVVFSFVEQDLNYTQTNFYDTVSPEIASNDVNSGSTTPIFRPGEILVFSARFMPTVNLPGWTDHGGICRAVFQEL